MSRIRTMLVLLSTAALAATGAAAVSADPARAAAGAAVSVWETTADQSQLLAPQARATFAAGAPLQQWTCTGGSNQNFALTAQS
jgi:glucosylceramidase